MDGEGVVITYHFRESAFYLLGVALAAFAAFGAFFGLVYESETKLDSVVGRVRLVR